MCQSGFIDIFGDGSQCNDVDECQDMPCDLATSTCLNGFGSYACRCRRGFYDVAGDGSRCEDVDECNENSGVCGTNALCQNMPGNYTCICPRGFEMADRSCTNIDECAIGAHDCVEPASCVDEPGTYACACPAGYLAVQMLQNGVSVTVCEDIDECDFEFTNACGSSTDCANIEGAYECSCRAGYTPIESNPHACNDVDECIGNGSRANGGCWYSTTEVHNATANITSNVTLRSVCTNLVGSRACGACPPGLIGDPTIFCYDPARDAGPADVERTLVTIPSVAVAGESVLFSVKLFDSQGVGLQINSPNSSFPTDLVLTFLSADTAHDHTVSVPVAFWIDGDGSLPATVVLQRAGRYSVLVNMTSRSGDHSRHHSATALVDHEPVLLNIEPAIASHLSSLPVQGQPCLQTAQAGVRCHFSVDVSDEFGNPQVDGRVSVDAVGVLGATFGREVFVASSRFGHTMNFDYVVFNPTGLYHLTLYVEGIALPSYLIRVTAGAAELNKCHISGQSFVSAGSVASMTVTFFDVYDNAGALVNGTVAAHMVHGHSILPCSDASAATPTSQVVTLVRDENTYAGYHNTTAAGQYALSVFVDRHTVQSTTDFVITVNSLPVDSSRSQVYILGTTNNGSTRATAGENVHVAFVAFDKFGNRIENTDELDVEMVLQSPNAPTIVAHTVHNSCGQNSFTFGVEFANNGAAYRTNCTINGNYISKVVSIFVQPAELFGPASMLQYTGGGNDKILISEAGQVISTTVRTRDVFGNFLSTGNATICGAIVSDTGTPDGMLEVQDNHNGAYLIEISAAAAGHYAVRFGLWPVTRNDIDCQAEVLSDLSLAIVVVPGNYSASQSIVFGPGTSGGIQGMPMEMYLVVVDSYGNIVADTDDVNNVDYICSLYLNESQAASNSIRLTSGPQYNQFADVGMGGAPIVLAITYTAPSSLEANFLLRTTLSLLLNGEIAFFNENMHFYYPGYGMTVDPHSSRLAFAGTFLTESLEALHTRAGAVTTFAITLFTETQVQIVFEDGSDAVDLAGETLSASLTNGTVQIPVSRFEYAGAGTFIANFTVISVPIGELRLHMSVDGIFVGGSQGYSVNVQPGSSSTTTSGIVGLIPHATTAGAGEVFLLESRDRYGNMQRGSSDVYVVQVTQPDLTVVYWRVTVAYDGAYRVQIDATSSGVHVFNITLNEQWLSTHTIQVHPAMPDAASSALIGYTDVVMAGQDLSTVFAARIADEYGNIISNPSVPLATTWNGSSVVSTSVSMIWSVDEIKYVPHGSLSLMGIYSVGIFFAAQSDSRPIGLSLHHVTVLAADFTANRSHVSLLTPSHIAANGAIAVTVVTHDRFGNPTTQGSRMVAVLLNHTTEGLAQSVAFEGHPYWPFPRFAYQYINISASQAVTADGPHARYFQSTGQALAVGQYSIVVQVGPDVAPAHTTALEDFVILSGANLRSTFDPVFVSVAPVAAPRVVLAQFADSGAKIVVTFDQDTNYGRTSHHYSSDRAEDCSNFIVGVYDGSTDQTLNNTGGMTSCSWLTGTAMEISIGAYTPSQRMVQPGDHLAVSNVLTVSENSLPVNTSKFPIAWPTSRPVPQVVIKLPGVVSQCDTAWIDVSNSGNSGGRPMVFQYTVSPTPGHLAPSQGTLETLQNQLNSFEGVRNLIDIGNVSIFGGYSFDFTVTATNYLGGSSNATKTIVKSRLSTPSVLINGKGHINMRAGDTLLLTSDASFASCYSGSKLMKYEWTIASVELGKTATTRKLTVPPFTLSPLHSYEVRLLGYMEANHELQNTALAHVTVDVSEISAGLVGCAAFGDCRRRIGLDSGLFVLDASPSNDPDMRDQHVAQFNYAWSCIPIVSGTERNDLSCASNSPQFLSTLNGNSHRIVLDPLSLDLLIHGMDVHQYKFIVTVTSTLYGQTRRSSRAVLVTVEPGAPPTVEVTRVITNKSDRHLKANPSEQISYRCSTSVNVTDPAVEAAFSWTVVGPNVPADVSKYASSNGKESLLLLPKNTLTPGGTYSISCDVVQKVHGVAVSANAHTTACVVNAPPSSGSMEILHGWGSTAERVRNNMVVAGALENKVTFVVSGFVDDPEDIPNGFEYQYMFLFGCVTLNSIDDLAALSQSPKIIHPGMFDSRFEATLPPAMEDSNRTFTMITLILDQFFAAAVRTKCIAYDEYVIDPGDAHAAADSILSEEGAAGLAKATGDTDRLMMAFTSTAAALCAVNPSCASYMPNRGDKRRLTEVDASFETRFQILSDISNVIAGDSLASMASIQQKLEQVAIQTNNVDELSVDSQRVALQLLRILISAMPSTGDSLTDAAETAAMLIISDFAQLTNASGAANDIASNYSSLHSLVQIDLPLLLHEILKRQAGSACGTVSHADTDEYFTLAIRRVCNNNYAVVPGTNNSLASGRTTMIIPNDIGAQARAAGIFGEPSFQAHLFVLSVSQENTSSPPQRF